MELLLDSSWRRGCGSGFAIEGKFPSILTASPPPSPEWMQHGNEALLMLTFHWFPVKLKLVWSDWRLISAVDRMIESISMQAWSDLDSLFCRQPPWGALNTVNCDDHGSDHPPSPSPRVIYQHRQAPEWWWPTNLWSRFMLLCFEEKSSKEKRVRPIWSFTKLSWWTRADVIGRYRRPATCVVSG